MEVFQENDSPLQFGSVVQIKMGKALRKAEEHLGCHYHLRSYFQLGLTREQNQKEPTLQWGNSTNSADEAHQTIE